MFEETHFIICNVENVVHQVVVRTNLGILGIAVSKNFLFDYYQKNQSSSD